MSCKHISVVNGKGNIIRKSVFKLHSLHFSIEHVRTTHGLISTNRWLLNCALYLLIYRVAISNRFFFFFCLKMHREITLPMIIFQGSWAIDGTQEQITRFWYIEQVWAVCWPKLNVHFRILISNYLSPFYLLTLIPILS